MRIREFVVPVAVVSAVFTLVFRAARTELPTRPDQSLSIPAHELDEITDRVNDRLRQTWREMNLQAAPEADDLTVLRRLALALHGSIPSLEEIREFESDHAPNRLDRWTSRMLEDPRFSEYFAERLARSLVGTDEGVFFIYRRDQFVEWLAERLRRNRPYDEIVRQILADEGLWTGQPATNFIMAAYANDDLDENKLAGRTVRAFLGQRIDCAQCHDHPFDPAWKQSDFEGLAAFFGQTRLTIVGVEDKPAVDGEPLEYRVEDRKTLETRIVAPDVPFGRELLPDGGSRRERLAAWVTHPENRRFERALVNRMWALVFGLPYLSPVDDLPHPTDTADLLDLLGADFREHDYDLRRLIHMITRTAAFRRDSRHDTDTSLEVARHKSSWAVFPLVRLRPEQVIGALFQASSVQTVDVNSHLLIRFQRFNQERDFLEDYGDLGDDELEERAGTIPQALLRMNGSIIADSIEAGLLKSAGSISGYAPDAHDCIEACYLTCLTRRPTPEETADLVPVLESATTEKERKQAVEDLFWALVNSPEFAWNH